MLERYRPEDNIAFVESSTYQEAIAESYLRLWKQAIQEELVAHLKNETWTIVNRPANKSCIDSRWIFKVQEAKTDGGRGGPRFKARLCATGFRQEKDVDYQETFALVVRYGTIRLMLAYAAHEEKEIMQFDVKTAFLYEKLTEETYMEVPENLEKS